MCRPLLHITAGNLTSNEFYGIWDCPVACVFQLSNPFVLKNGPRVNQIGRIDGSVQDCVDSIANALELPQSCT